MRGVTAGTGDAAAGEGLADRVAGLGGQAGQAVGAGSGAVDVALFQIMQRQPGVQVQAAGGAGAFGLEQYLAALDQFGDPGLVTGMQAVPDAGVVQALQAVVADGGTLGSFVAEFLVVNKVNGDSKKLAGFRIVGQLKYRV